MSVNESFSLEEIELRYTEAGDSKYLKEWLMDPGVRNAFPMNDELEVNDAVARWIYFHKYKSSLTALYQGEPIGLATLYLQPYRRIAHQCEFGIIVDEKWRGRGIGALLIKNIIHLAKAEFRIELLHLQVYGGNPAVRLYERCGFVEFGRQAHWLKDIDNQYVARIFMEKLL